MNTIDSTVLGILLKSGRLNLVPKKITRKDGVSTTVYVNPNKGNQQDTNVPKEVPKKNSYSVSTTYLDKQKAVNKVENNIFDAREKVHSAELEIGTIERFRQDFDTNWPEERPESKKKLWKTKKAYKEQRERMIKQISEESMQKAQQALVNAKQHYDDCIAQRKELYNEAVKLAERRNISTAGTASVIYKRLEIQDEIDNLSKEDRELVKDYNSVDECKSPREQKAYFLSKWGMSVKTIADNVEPKLATAHLRGAEKVLKLFPNMANNQVLELAAIDQTIRIKGRSIGPLGTIEMNHWRIKDYVSWKINNSIDFESGFNPSDSVESSMIHEMVHQLESFIQYNHPNFKDKEKIKDLHHFPNAVSHNVILEACEDINKSKKLGEKFEKEYTGTWLAWAAKKNLHIYGYGKEITEYAKTNCFECLAEGMTSYIDRGKDSKMVCWLLTKKIEKLYGECQV